MTRQRKAALVGFARAAAITAVFNTVVAVAILPFVDNSLGGLLLTSHLIGYTILFLVYPVLRLKLRPLWRWLSTAAALTLGAVLGTVLVVIAKGYDLDKMFADPSHLRVLTSTIVLALVAGTVALAVLATRARIARADAELMRSEADRQRLARKHAEAELKVVRAQIEPHFLFNTLANLSFLIKEDPQLALAMLENLIDYLQAAVPRIRGETSTLRNELAMASAYVSILQIRMGDRLRAIFDVPPEHLAIAFPPMMLITLVENAIKHGLNELAEGGTITVTSSRDEQRLRLCVADSGVGFPGAHADLRGGVGLVNIEERLAAMYGAQGRLTLSANSPRGTVATIEIPIEGTADA